MNEVLGRYEHCFTGQRTRFEGRNIVAEHAHDEIYELLGQAHASMMNRGGNQVEGVDTWFRGLHG